MKTIIYKVAILTVMVLFASTSIYSSNQDKKDSLKTDDSKVCLEIIGMAINEKNEPMDEVSVKLFQENEEMECVEVTCVNYHDHNFVFNLNSDKYYTIEISKPGYVTRLVAISTTLPQDVNPEPIFKYAFDIMLYKEKKGVEDYYLDFPIALIGYNSKHDVFENHDAYTQHIKSKIKHAEFQAKN